MEPSQHWAESLPLVSVVMPIRNEEQHVGACLGAIIAQDYAGQLEVLVVDGMSQDRSRSIVSRFAEAHPFIRLLDNPARNIPAALNIGIRHAGGDVIVRVDGRTIIQPDYVRRCVLCLQHTGAGNVGGLQRAVGQSYFGETIAFTTRSPLAVGDAKFRYADTAGPVDTVYLGAFPRQIFDQVGLYNEDLVRNQDYELNHRIRQAGYQVYLDPEIKSWYLNRTTWGDFWRQYFHYGFWKVEMLSRHPASLRWRQLAPPTLVASLFVAGVLGRFWRPLNIVFRLIVTGYAALASVFTLRTARKHGWRYAPALPLAFASIHLAWGLGFLLGLIRLLARNSWPSE